MSTDDSVAKEKMHLFSGLADMGVSLMTLLLVLMGNKSVSAAKTAEEKKEAVKQQLPSLFGWGKADEQIYATLLAVLEPAEVTSLTTLVAKMDDNEAEQFRVIVTGIRTETEEGDAKHRVNIEFTDKDNRVKFLKSLAKQIGTGDASSALDMLKKNKFLSGEPSSLKAKKFAAKMLGLASIDDLAEPAKIVEAIEKSRLKVQAELHKINNPTSKLEAWAGRLFNI
ncbi:MAG: hypothetical protein Q7K40_02155 [bacterium]|nr:hypothetical protein [bacterium]